MLTAIEKGTSLPAPSELDILFLYRTNKKKRYFSHLKDYLATTLNCEVQSYHELPGVRTKALETRQLNEIVFKAEQELYNAKSDAWQTLKVWMRPFLIDQIKKLYSRLFCFLSEKRPKVLAIWNGHKWQDNVLHAVNAHFRIPVAYFENGVLPDSTTMDFCGINALNSVPREVAFYQQLPQAPSDLSSKVVGRKYKNKTAKQSGFSLPDRYLLVPFQKDRDSQLLDNSSWIKSMTQLFGVLISALESSDRHDLHLVFREHPSAKKRHAALHKLAAMHPRVCFDQQSDLSDIITRAEAVVTVNSTVGLEALLLKTKVITLGDAFYDLPSLVLRAASTPELATHINALGRFTPDRDVLQKFIGYLKQDYVIPGDWKTPSTLHLQRVEQRFLRHLPGMAPSTGDDACLLARHA